MNLGNLAVWFCCGRVSLLAVDLAATLGIQLPVWLAPPLSGLPPARAGLSPCAFRCCSLCLATAFTTKVTSLNPPWPR